MKKINLLLIICLIISQLNAQPLHSYVIYNHQGKQVSFGFVVDEVVNSNIILFGELHDNPISHWLQLELCHAIEGKGVPMTLGAEMFEADNQLILEEYLTGMISQMRFENEIRLWGNYKTDYKPLVEFAKEKGVQFVATNIPRRYAAMVSSGGFEALDKLSPEAKGYVAPLPVEYDEDLPGYQAMLSMGGMPGKGGVNHNLPKAQAIKDATMAWNIAQNFEEGKIFVHFHGTYHSDNYEGIGWYLKRYSPKLRQVTVATVLQDEVETLSEEHRNLADFIIVVPMRMTRTY